MSNEMKSTQSPLTVILAFSALSEALSIGALGLLEDGLHKYFIWFVMGYPIIITSIFFYLLWKKREVFYAPKDYLNSEHFIKILQTRSTEMKALVADGNSEEDVKTKLKQYANSWEDLDSQLNEHFGKKE